MTLVDVVLPNLGFGMEEGRVLTWLKPVGSAVKKGEPLLEVESDKANVELEALADGVLVEIIVPADTLSPVGAVLARIQTDAGASVAQTNSVVATPDRASAVSAVVEEARGLQASPVARRMAHEHGLDLREVKGSGTGGRITREDVEAALRVPARPLAAPAVRKWLHEHNLDLRQIRGTGLGGRITRKDALNALAVAQPPAPVLQAPSAPPAVATATPSAPVPAQDGRREVPLSAMRQTIARRLTQSMQDSPHFYVSAELDFTDALKKLPEGVGVNNLLLYLTVQALRANPALNATYENGHLYQYDAVHLAIAVALPAGLLTPVLRGASDFSLSGLASRARDLISRAREGKLKADEMQGGTFTVSNLGVVKQIDHFTAIINPPQVGILAIGALKERPVVRNGGLHIRNTAFLTLSADHRVVDGMVAARFIEAFDGHLQAFTG